MPGTKYPAGIQKDTIPVLESFNSSGDMYQAICITAGNNQEGEESRAAPGFGPEPVGRRN